MSKQTIEEVILRFEDQLIGIVETMPTNVDAVEKQLDKLVEEVLATIEQLVLEVIGEDEPEYSQDNPTWGTNRRRNELRVEMRKALSQLLGREEKTG